MSRPRRVDKVLVKKAQEIVARTKDLEEYRSAQAILLPSVLGATLVETASVTGVSRATVQRLQVRFREGVRSGGVLRRRRRGGRRNQLLTHEEEKAFLAPWEEQAKTGGVLAVSAGMLW